MVILMKRFGISLLSLVLILILVTVWGLKNKSEQNKVSEYTQEQVMYMMDKAWQSVVDTATQDTVRQKEVTAEASLIPYYDFETDNIESMEADVCSITDGEYTMQYIKQVIGEPDANGLYPLYICLHGGGSDDEEGLFNNEQWLEMTTYYRDSVESGIYVAVRGITNNWNLHFEDASYPLYDRLIEDMTLLCNADPNRVYLLGFSAGGDGVYFIAPRMADRFAAVNQSSGHPNGNTLMNVANLPICIQSGIRDTMFSPKRSVAAATFDKQLDDYREEFGFGYSHEVYIHVPEGHNYYDNIPTVGDCQLVLEEPQMYVDLMNDPKISEQYPEEFSYDYDDEINNTYLELTQKLGMKIVEKDTNAVRFVSQFSRNAHPNDIVWDLSVRAQCRENKSFYWLEADDAVNIGLIHASFDQEENLFDIQFKDKPNGDFNILMHPDMVDFSRPVYVRYGNRIVEADFQIDEAEILASMTNTMDRDLAYASHVSFSSLGFDYDAYVESNYDNQLQKAIEIIKNK